MGVLSINTDTTDELVARLSKAGSSMANAKDSMEGSYSTLKGSDKLYGGIGKVANNFSVVSERFLKLSKNISKNSHAVVETDMKLSKLADEIVIPDDLKTVDSAFDIETNVTKLSKKDGKSIKTGETEEQTYDDSSIVIKEALENIDNSTASTSDLSDEYSETKQELTDINKESDITVSEVTDETHINKEELADINNSINTEETNIDTALIDEMKKINLESTSTDSVLEKEELHDEKYNKIHGVNVEVPSEEDILNKLE